MSALKSCPKKIGVIMIVSVFTHDTPNLELCASYPCHHVPEHSSSIM